MCATDIKSLESILKQKFGNNLILESYKINDFLQPGENYGSIIVSVDTKIRKNVNEKIESIHMIAKLPPKPQKQRDTFGNSFTFKKEIFMYNDIIPAYRKLEIDNGVDEGKAFNSVATYYGSRLTFDNDDNKDNGDDDDFYNNAVILLENLKCKNYYMVNRRFGCDLPHAKLVIKSLARFHSLGIGIKHQNPELFEIFKIKSKCLGFERGDELKKKIPNTLIDILLDKEINKYYDKCCKLTVIGDAKSWEDTPNEPWSTIIHADFWPNNLLFHKSLDTDEPDDVKFIDFENYLFLNPIRDLTFFIGCSVTSQVMMNNYQLLEDLYYDTLIERLKILKCDIKLYSRDTFNKALCNEAKKEFSHIMWILKIMTMDIEADDPNARNVMNLYKLGKPSKNYYNRLRQVILYYNQRGWLDD